MMMHIDVSSVLRQTLSCELYSNLVTRPTGAAVRTQIEALLGDSRERTLTVIDFSHVGMIDFSCADEVVAKLLLRYVAEERGNREAYFLFRGVTEDHWDAIEAVLERHGLALVLESADGSGAHVGGIVNDRERVAWNTVYELGRAAPADVASAIGSPPSDCERLLETLHRRRLLMRLEDDYIAVGGLADARA
ncbi:MAG: hypothetical protein HOQ17_14655 [Gemmatimonadaceae bacterium]|nr:hypothetical protein [Gemmatimonadaceae bacterium]NUO95994.1 hypothetical protein [Gemmatimonadaceae bacterium]NUP54332.1 hypothetical protein [Gemmatimonadaceae bacterium]NUP72682.1 hypothetical protein [Gemmatimonadaceae bacterium]NUR35931.1 hypothetical protein [Gemmatimonadaceae bacterium]